MEIFMLCASFYYNKKLICVGITWKLEECRVLGPSPRNLGGSQWELGISVLRHPKWF